MPSAAPAAAGDVNAADIAQRLVEGDDLLVFEHLVRDHLGRERRLHDRRVDLGAERFDRRGIRRGIVAHPVGADLAVVAGADVGSVVSPRPVSEALARVAHAAGGLRRADVNGRELFLRASRGDGGGGERQGSQGNGAQ